MSEPRPPIPNPQISWGPWTEPAPILPHGSAFFFCVDLGHLGQREHPQEFRFIPSQWKILTSIEVSLRWQG